MLLSKASVRTIYLVKRFEAIVKTELEKALRGFGVTPGQYTTMSLLKANGDTSSAELARRVAISPQSMSEMITLLERKELVARHEKPANRRILRIELTGAGARLLTQCEQKVNGIEKKLLAPLQAGELDTLRSLLSRILDDANDDYL